MFFLKQTYPKLANFSEGFYQRRSKSGRIGLVRLGTSRSRMLQRRIAIKNRLSAIANAGQISESRNTGKLLGLKLNQIPSNKRRSYAAVVKGIVRGLR